MLPPGLPGFQIRRLRLGDACHVRRDAETGQMTNSCTNEATCGVRVISAGGEGAEADVGDDIAHVPRLTEEHEQLFRAHVHKVYPDLMN